MHIYFSGIGGVGIGPLAKIAAQAGHEVSGSDAAASSMTRQLEQYGIEVFIGQTGAEIAQEHARRPIDWLVISAAIPADHPEVVFAKAQGIRISKRDELLNEIITQADQKLVAVSGTHGKTTTTAMLVWLFKQFDISVSYSVGTQISFGPSGQFDPKANYFVYEADEFDRNMLHFHPYMALLTTIDYDHPDIYPTQEAYNAAFQQFVAQSQNVLAWQQNQSQLKLAHPRLTLLDRSDPAVASLSIVGQHYRQNAWLAVQAFCQLFPDKALSKVVTQINAFPGTARRFEKLADNVYCVYSHHPAEIKADLQMAREVNERVIAVYQPHQNIRQHELQDHYGDCFTGAEHVYWLPTYLSREDPSLAVLSSEHLIRKLSNPMIAEPAEMNAELVQAIRRHVAQGSLVLIMGAGDVDDWARQQFVQ